MKTLTITLLAALFVSPFAHAEDHLDKAEQDSLRINGNALVCRSAPDAINALMIQGWQLTGKKVHIRQILNTERGSCVHLVTADK